MLKKICNNSWSKKRVFIVYWNLGLGGIQTKIISLANSLVNQEVDCWLFLEEEAEHSRMLLLEKRVKVIRFYNYKIFNYKPFCGEKMSYMLFLFVVLFRPGSIFVPNFQENPRVWFLALDRFMPKWTKRTIFNEDTQPSLEVNYERSDKFVRYISKTYNKAKRVIAVSKSAFDDLKDNFKVTSPPLIHIPNWVNFNKSKLPKSSGRDIDVVYGGRLSKQKQPKLLAKLFYLLLKKQSGLNIHVYGDGDQKQLFLNELKNLKIDRQIRYSLPVEDFQKVLSKSKILVFTSLYEGLPFTGIEAMKAGAVNACLNVPGLKDLVLKNETGILEDSLQKLATEVSLLLEKPQKLSLLRRNAYYYARDHFSEKNEKELIKIMLE